MTTKNYHDKAKVIKETWSKRFDKVLFVSESRDNELPTHVVNVPGDRNHLTGKTMQTFDYLYANHLDEYHWFMKADDDTFVIYENLRFLLEGYSEKEPLIFGHHFLKTPILGTWESPKAVKSTRNGYLSGGAGYVISREALRRYGQRRKGLCRKDGGSEDHEWMLCMEKLGVQIGNSTDNMGRSRFHYDKPSRHINNPPAWPMGVKDMSDYPISFHYVSPELMKEMDYYVYRLNVHNGV